MAGQLALDSDQTTATTDRVCLLCGLFAEGCDGTVCHVYDAD